MFSADSGKESISKTYTTLFRGQKWKSRHVGENSSKQPSGWFPTMQEQVLPFRIDGVTGGVGGVGGVGKADRPGRVIWVLPDSLPTCDFSSHECFSGELTLNYSILSFSKVS